MLDFEIRPARDEDAARIAEIYNHAVRTSTATFDTVEKTVEDRLNWLHEHGDHYPVVVVVLDHFVVGWGSISRYAERPGWRYTVENAIYLDPDYCGRGIGKAILEHLILEAKKQNFHAIIAQIVAGNESSIRLHEKFGFETVGVMKEVGNKFDQWLDIVLMELRI